MVLKPGCSVCCHEFKEGKVHFGEVVIGDGCTLEAYAAVGAGTILPAGTVVKGNAPEQAAAAPAAAKAAGPAVAAEDEDAASSGAVNTAQTVLSEVSITGASRNLCNPTMHYFFSIFVCLGNEACGNICVLSASSIPDQYVLVLAVLGQCLLWRTGRRAADSAALCMGPDACIWRLGDIPSHGRPAGIAGARGHQLPGQGEAAARYRAAAERIC